MQASTKSIHVLVALCDNFYQGIFPVSYSLGNGQNPKTNLYWGAMYGAKTYFDKQKEWVLVSSKSVDKIVLQRAIYKHKTKDVYLVLDAYNGKNMKETLKDYFAYLAGDKKIDISIGKKSVGFGGNADMVLFVGHNGLMDYELSNIYKNGKLPIQSVKNTNKQTAVLGCQSKIYFQEHLKKLNIKTAYLTTGNMAPEGYVVYAVVDGFVNELSKDEVRKNIAVAYSKYQKLKNPAIKLFVYE